MKPKLLAFLPFLALSIFIGASFVHADPSMGARGFIESDGEKIYYEVYGEGDPVIFCHGFGGNHAIWYQQVHEFAKHYQVITWDHRGFGQSTNTKKESSPESGVRDLLAILDHLNIEKAHIIAQSMGGWSAVGFALDHPDRLRSVVLADTLGGIYTPEIEEAFDAFIRSRFSAPARGALPFGAHSAIGPKHTAANPTHSFLYEQIGTATSPPPPTIPKLLRNTQYAHDDLAKLSLPVLFVVGSDDPIFPPHAIRAAAKLIPGSEVIEMPDAGHSPYFEQPEVWNNAVLKFLTTTY